ncbi:MAG: hypothetical protein E7632_07760 [Ruminococcaceae bacterium]|nr:hypothetical protein [Oscillospiraceae bacterium]
MDYFVIDREMTISFPAEASHPVLSEILNNYTYGLPWKILRDHEDYTITAGDFSAVPLDENEFALNITPGGVYIAGTSYNALMRGFVTFLEKIFCYDKLLYKAKCGTVFGHPEIGVRSVHLCVWPDKETSLTLIDKAIRLAAMSRYTHVILEFWGTIKLDALPALAWPFAYTKGQIRELVAVARALGLEVIPMLQHLGHAAMARQGASGKHVVLDQAPELEYLYLPEFYGWVWDYRKPVVRELLTKLRDELCDLCGPGSYFLLGCDEADDLGKGEDALEIAAELCEYLNSVQADLASKGRRAIMWGDMLLSQSELAKNSRGAEEAYAANSSPEFAEAMRNGLDRGIIIADWQYEITSEPWQSAAIFARYGFDILCCTWSKMANYGTALTSMRDNHALGFMKTTWNTLRRELPHLAFAGDVMYNGGGGLCYDVYAKTCSRVTSTLRRIKPCNDYTDAGWLPVQINTPL